MSHEYLYLLKWPTDTENEFGTAVAFSEENILAMREIVKLSEDWLDDNDFELEEIQLTEITSTKGQLLEKYRHTQQTYGLYEDEFMSQVETILKE